jgi:hypothetical protein
MTNELFQKEKREKKMLVVVYAHIGYCCFVANAREDGDIS